MYQLHHQASMLTQICATWQAKVHSIPCAYQMPLSWGPSELELAKALVVKFNERWNEIVDNEEMRMLKRNQLRRWRWRWRWR